MATANTSADLLAFGNSMRVAAGDRATFANADEVCQALMYGSLVFDALERTMHIAVPPRRAQSGDPSEAQANRLQDLIDVLEGQVLKMSLDHIKGPRVVRGELTDILNLAEIVSALVSMPWQPGHAGVLPQDPRHISPAPTSNPMSQPLPTITEAPDEQSQPASPYASPPAAIRPQRERSPPAHAAASAPEASDDGTFTTPSQGQRQEATGVQRTSLQAAHGEGAGARQGGRALGQVELDEMSRAPTHELDGGQRRGSGSPDEARSRASWARAEDAGSRPSRLAGSSLGSEASSRRDPPPAAPPPWRPTGRSARGAMSKASAPSALFPVNRVGAKGSARQYGHTSASLSPVTSEMQSDASPRSESAAEAAEEAAVDGFLRDLHPIGGVRSCGGPTNATNARWLRSPSKRPAPGRLDRTLADRLSHVVKLKQGSPKTARRQQYRERRQRQSAVERSAAKRALILRLQTAAQRRAAHEKRMREERSMKLQRHALRVDTIKEQRFLEEKLLTSERAKQQRITDEQRRFRDAFLSAIQAEKELLLDRRKKLPTWGEDGDDIQLKSIREAEERSNELLRKMDRMVYDLSEQLRMADVHEKQLHAERREQLQQLRQRWIDHVEDRQSRAYHKSHMAQLTQERIQSIRRLVTDA